MKFINRDFIGFFKGRTIIGGSIISSIASENEDFEEYKKLKGLYIENDWERVKTLFQKDDYGKYHPLLVEVLQNLQLGFMAGAAFGGTLRSLAKSKEFIRNNDTTLFLNKRDLRQKWESNSFKGIMKGIFEWGPRVSILFGSYTFISNCISLYRNKSGILEHTLGGLGAGALLRSHYGIRGFISGGVVGTVGGTIFGTLKWGILKLFGVEEIELQYSQYALMKYREKQSAGTQHSSYTDEMFEIHKKNDNLHVNNPLNTLSDKVMDKDTVKEN